MNFIKLKMTLFVCLLHFACEGRYSLHELSVEEKVGQVLMVHFNGEEVNRDAKVLIQGLHIGGIIYYNWANGLHSPDQVRKLSQQLQKLNSNNLHAIPLLIATDQEGGVVTRLQKGVTQFPGNKALGIAGDPKLAESSALIMGRELRSVGVNMVLAPVADVNSNPRNPVIGIRSFGDTPEVVISFAGSALAGYQKSKIITSLKHYPGHGDVEIDSHEDLPVLNKSKEQLEKMELLPFAKLASQADTITTAHIIVPAFDKINCATLSKPTLDYLREIIGFHGVIITDSLVMEGLLKNCASLEDAAIRAFNAGCDILDLGGKQLTGTDANLEITIDNVKSIHKALVDAVNNGVISHARLDQAVLRILNLKNRYALGEIPKEAIELNAASSQALAKKIATAALKVIKNKPLPAKLEQSKVALFAPVVVRDNLCPTPLPHMGKENTAQFFIGLNPTDKEAKAAQAVAKNADVLVFCSYNAWKNSSQAALITSLLQLGKPMILVALRDPLDGALFPQANLVLMTYSPSTPSIIAVYEKLMEKSK